MEGESIVNRQARNYYKCVKGKRHSRNEGTGRVQAGRRAECRQGDRQGDM